MPVISSLITYTIVLAINSPFKRWFHLYFCGAFALGVGFLHYGVRCAVAKSKVQARRLLQASVLYLPLVYALMMIDKIAP